jgi:hypothetical protein
MNNTSMQKTIGVGISLPKEIIRKIDKQRGDIPRSRYFLRMLEEQSMCEYCEKKGIQDSTDSRFETLQSTESRSP